MSTTKRTWIIFLIGAGLTLIAAGLSPLLIAVAQEDTAATAEATAEVTPTPDPNAPNRELTGLTPEPVYIITEPVEVTGNNSYCLVCHNQPWHTTTLQDGSIQNLYVNPETVAASVHGTNNSQGAFGCVDCHGADVFPHDQPSPTDSRSFRIQSVQICASCHAQEARDLESGLHEEAIRAGDTQAAVCIDCHGSHNVQRVVEQPELIAGVCGDCHTPTLAEWRSSPHVNIGPLGCATCHAPHSQRLRAGNSPDALCMNCHDNIPNQLVHRQHLDTGTRATVTCIDCHMYRDEANATASASISTIPLSTGHSMLMDTAPCTTCHEELVASGEWTQLVDAQNATYAEATAEATAEPAPTEVASTALSETDEAIAASENTSYVQLLQGLILGLGFGVTFAAVFITRGNRSPVVAVTSESQPVSQPEPVQHGPAPSSPEGDAEGSAEKQHPQEGE
ncbi:MAG: cytochrome c3 family protein [Anaerolineae bacterium]